MYEEERGIADGAICAECPTEESSLNMPPKSEELMLSLGCCRISREGFLFLSELA